MKHKCVCTPYDQVICYSLRSIQVDKDKLRFVSVNRMNEYNIETIIIIWQSLFYLFCSKFDMNKSRETIVASISG